MITLTAISPRQTNDYYTKDDYYARSIMNDDFWFGNGLNNDLGSEITTVSKNKQAPLLMNDYLNTVEKIRDNLPRDSTKLALDLTFSPPKSLSIAALDPFFKSDLINAHNEAMKVVLNKVEKECMVWRKHEGNKTSYVNTGNMLAACIQHQLSREQDPQLHTHVIIFRKTETPNGYGTIEDKILYNKRYLYSLIYDNELSNQLQKRGYRLVPTEKPNKRYTGYELDGISEQLINHFSKRSTQLKSYQKHNEISDSWEGSHLAAKASRKAKEKTDLEKLKSQWQLAINDLGGISVSKHSIKQQTHSLLHLNEYIKESIHELESEKFAFTKEALQIRFLEKTMLTGATEKDFDSVFNYNLYNSIVPIGHLPKDKNMHYTTRDNLSQAKQIDSLLSKKSLNFYSFYEKEDAIAAVEEQNKSLKETFNWSLTKGQTDAITSILSSKEKYIAIEGIAGSGKTTALKYVTKLLDDKGITVKGMTFTGKAAEAMENESNLPSSTIHKFFNRLTNQKNIDIENPKWDFSKIEKSPTKEVWIVDESSMLNDRLMKNILEASEKVDSKVVFLGDSNQLLPIGTGNAFHRMVTTNQVPTTHMREINRQEKDSELKKTVEALSGKFPDSVKNPIEKYLNDKIIENSRRKSLLNSITRDYCSYSPEEQEKTVILVAKNKDREEINQKIRKRLIQKGQLSGSISLEVKNHYDQLEKKSFSIGEKVIFGKNSYKTKDINGELLPIKNGQIGKIIDIRSENIIIETNKRLISVNSTDKVNLDYAYAMTSHKAQGITVNNALIYHNSEQRQLNSRNKLYVDVSRAKKNVKIYTNNRNALVRQTRNFQKKYTFDEYRLKKKETPKTYKDQKNLIAKNIPIKNNIFHIKPNNSHFISQRKENRDHGKEY